MNTWISLQINPRVHYKKIVLSYRAARFVLLVDILKARAMFAGPYLAQSKAYRASLKRPIAAISIALTFIYFNYC